MFISAERDAGADKTTLPSSPQKSPLFLFNAAQEPTRVSTVGGYREGVGGVRTYKGGPTFQPSS